MSAVLENTTKTNLAELRTQQRPPEERMPIVRAGFGDLQGFELAQRAAKALAASTLVPQQFQGNLPNCLIALEMAQRIGASPLMVMQNLYIVHGRPGWSAKFLIASFNQCGRFSAVRFEWVGERGKDDWGCRAWAIERESGEKIIGPLITIQLSKDEGWYGKAGSKWKTIPELMLQYRAAAWMVNTHAPEISMGLNTSEEMHDVYEATAGADGTYGVRLDDLRGSDGTGGTAGGGSTIDAGTGEILGGAASSGEPTFTVVDACAKLNELGTVDALAEYVDALPNEIKDDERLTRAFKARMDQIKEAAANPKREPAPGPNPNAKK